MSPRTVFLFTATEEPATQKIVDLVSTDRHPGMFPGVERWMEAWMKGRTAEVAGMLAMKYPHPILYIIYIMRRMDMGEARPESCVCLAHAQHFHASALSSQVLMTDALIRKPAYRILRRAFVVFTSTFAACGSAFWTWVWSCLNPRRVEPDLLHRLPACWFSGLARTVCKYSKTGTVSAVAYPL